MGLDLQSVSHGTSCSQSGHHNDESRNCARSPLSHPSIPPLWWKLLSWTCMFVVSPPSMPGPSHTKRSPYQTYFNVIVGPL